MWDQLNNADFSSPGPSGLPSPPNTLAHLLCVQGSFFCDQPAYESESLWADLSRFSPFVKDVLSSTIGSFDGSSGSLTGLAF